MLMLNDLGLGAFNARHRALRFTPPNERCKLPNNPFPARHSPLCFAKELACLPDRCVSEWTRPPNRVFLYANGSSPFALLAG